MLTRPFAARSASSQLIADASLVSKAALLVLLAFSVVSWGIILSKAFSLSRAERQTRSFLEVFRKSAKFSEVQGGVQVARATARWSACSRPAMPS